MFGKKKDADATGEHQKFNLDLRKTSKATAEGSDPNKTVIGKDVVVVGNFDAKEPIELYGTIRGNVRSVGSLYIAEGGSLIGEAVVETLNLDGKVDGTVHCTDVASLSKSAKMKGNLSTAKLRTEDGSVFEGKLNMVAKKPKKDAEKEASQEDAPEVEDEK